MPSTHPSKRKNVTTACVSCRESKIKCDGKSPTCSNCLRKGKSCQFPIGGDKRQVSHRAAINILASRVNQLSRFIIEKGFQPPPMQNGEDSELKRVLETLDFDRLNSKLGEYDGLDLEAQGIKPAVAVRQSRTGSDPLVPSVEVGRTVQVQVQGEENTGQLDLGWAPLSSLPELSGPITSSTENEGRSSDPSPSSENTAADEVVNQLSDRMGTLQIAPDGQLRYYGPTSNFNMIHMPAPDRLTIHRTVRNEGQDYLDRLGIGKEVPAEIEEHLLNLYFTWHDPAFHVVNREMYENARDKWEMQMEDTPYYSEALTNAMCCLGASCEPRHHQTFVTFPQSLSDFFADRAKALLEIELDCPSVASIQAMVVLSGHDIGCKRDARGWLYSGMAMRLCFALGLHIDASSYVEKGYITSAEAELRKTVFWGTYTVDHLWGFHQGRPFRVNMQDVTVDKPNGSVLHEWKPYVSVEDSGEDAVLDDPTDVLSKHRVLLCEIINPLGHILYGSSTMTNHELQRANEETTNKLYYWKSNLPDSLQVDLDDFTTPYLPQVLLLHMQYHHDIIHAHRPWMSKSYIQPQPPQGPGHVHAQRMCIDSGTSIAKLLALYDKHYGFRRIHIQAVSITCSAALILLFGAVFYPHQDEHRWKHLSVCHRALDEFGCSWESTKRARDFLITLQRRWERRAQGKAQQSHPEKRGSQATTGEMESGPDKRARRESMQQQQDDSPGFQAEVDRCVEWMLGPNMPGAGNWDANLL